MHVREAMNRAVKCRIEPNKTQKGLLEKTFGCCRFVYNRMLSDYMMAELMGEHVKLTPAMYKKDYPWLKEVDSLALCNAQLDLENAFRKHRSEKQVGHPRYKSKRCSRQSYTTNVVNGNIRIEGKKIRLPKIGMVRIRFHREISEDWKLKSVTVSRDPSGKYYASLLYEVPESESQTEGKRREKKCLGIDYAMDGLAVMSDGTRADYPKYFRQAEEKLAKEQRKLSHCVKGSRNYEKQKKRVAIVHEKIRNQRKDCQHKLSRALADEYDIIGVEDIDMKAMGRSLHFGKSVMDNGYGMFRAMLSYKLEERGGELVKIDRFFPSSKLCSCCGRVRDDLTLSDRIYICDCGNMIDRDVNAAINIRNEAMRIIAS
jgi:putative transposase